MPGCTRVLGATGPQQVAGGCLFALRDLQAHNAADQVDLELAIRVEEVLQSDLQWRADWQNDRRGQRYVLRHRGGGVPAIRIPIPCTHTVSLACAVTDGCETQ